MTTYNDTNIETPMTFNKLTVTQFNNASTVADDELYLVDPEFVGSRDLITSADGDIVEKGNVTDLTSTSITLALAKGGTNYHYGTLTAFTITANETSDLETTIYFTANSTGITVSLPATIEYVGNTPIFVAGKKYVISILNNALVAGEIV